MKKLLFFLLLFPLTLNAEDSPYDLIWDKLTADPVFEFGQRHTHWGRNDGYYDGAIMGNGLLGTNFYKLDDNAYRLNVGRSDVTEARDGEFNLLSKARLPIGYFALRPVGQVQKEEMRLHIFDAVTTGSLVSDKGSIDFKTYVHSCRDAIIFEAKTTGDESGYSWDFVPQQAVSPFVKHWEGNDAVFASRVPSDYLNCEGKSNPEPWLENSKGVKMLVQPLAADSNFSKINKYYIVAWKEVCKGDSRRVVATVAQDSDIEIARREALGNVLGAFKKSSGKLESQHMQWWKDFYARIATMVFPDPKVQGFYWMQCYKFASTARSGKPVVDLQGVWPTYDTPWPAIWMNLNIQLTYSWQTRVGLGEFAQPLWDALWNNRANLVRNVTDNPGQEDWTECMALPRASSYDMLSRLDPRLAERNGYEAGNLTWTLYYWYQQCKAYGDDFQMRERLFPLLKAAVNLFFRIRTVNPDGSYGLPPTASPEYKECVESIGPNSNYDLANLRWGLKALIEIDEKFGLNDEMLPQWKDFLEHLVPFRYSETTGFKVSDKFEFLDTNHRHYSHLFMIYPYHMLDWENPADSARMALSVDRWNGNTGYSLTGKASMLCSRGDGEAALTLMKRFLAGWVRHNTLYNESGPVIETPFAAMCSLEDMYMQDWGDRIRVFWGCPDSWKDCSFSNMRAAGAFRISARRENGRTVRIDVRSDKGGLCRLQTGMQDFCVKTSSGAPAAYRLVEAEKGVIEVDTRPGEEFAVSADPTELLAEKLLRQWSDALLSRQIKDGPDAGNFYCPSCPDGHGRVIDMVWPLTWLWDRTSDVRYLDAARDAVRWTVANLQESDGAIRNDRANGWKPITEFSQIALGKTLLRFGDKLPEELEDEWRELFLRQTGWIYGWLNKPWGNVVVNYLAASPLTMEIAYRVTGEEKYQECASRQTEVLKGQFAEDGLFFGESHPIDYRSPLGQRGVDFGYNMEESLPLMLEYAEMSGDGEFLRLLLASAREHLDFILPDGGLDNSSGSRSNKWTYWGSRTSDGVLPMLSVLARHGSPEAYHAAELTLGLYERCTDAEGLLAGGLYYEMAGEPACIHHSFCHIKSLPDWIDAYFSGVDRSGSHQLPSETAFGIKHYPSRGVYLLGTDRWRASVNNADNWCERITQTTAGGSLSLLYHRKAGLLLAGTSMEYKADEPLNMQWQRGDTITRCFTPRIEHGAFSNVYDKDVKISAGGNAKRAYVFVEGTLSDKTGCKDSPFKIQYLLQGDKLEIKVLGEGDFILPVIVAPDDALVFYGPRKLVIGRSGATVVLESEKAIRMEKTKRPSGLAFTQLAGLMGAYLSIPINGETISITLKVD